MAAGAEHEAAAGARGTAALADRWRSWRNRLAASPRFQRLAARMPFASRIARRESENLFRLTSGFVQSQILAAAVESGLLRLISNGKRRDREIGWALDLEPEALQRLLSGAEAAGLLERDRIGFWWLSPMGAVAAANPGIEAMIRHHRMLYADLADPVRLLRHPQAPTETARFWAYAGDRGDAVSEGEAGAYSRLMRLSQDLVSGEVLAAYSFGRHGSVLDVGGGDGAFLEALTERHPRIAAALFDLPPVAERAEARFAALGIPIDCRGGDFFTEALPETECITLVRVLCDHDDAAALRLLANIRRTARPGTRIVIAEAMAGKAPGEAMAAAYFSFYFLAMRSGRCRTPAEVRTLLSKAGFQGPARMRTGNPLIASIVTADV